MSRFYRKMEALSKRPTDFISDPGIPVIGTPETGTPTLGIPETGIPEATQLFGRRNQPKPVSRVQDAHSLGENRVYDELWRVGKPRGDGAKVVQVSYGRLKELTGLSLNTCKANILSLTQKLAIEELRGHTNVSARTYLVHPYAAILRRRESAGLTHVIKGKGVTFVHPQTGIPITGTPESGIARNRQTGIPVSDTYLLRDKSFRESTTKLREQLQNLLPAFDNAATDLLWQDCRANVQDVTEDEVARLFATKLPLSQNRSVANPNGFLVRAVARSCTPAVIGALRQGRELPNEDPMTFDPADMEALLSDPHTPESVKGRLQQMLESK